MTFYQRTKNTVLVAVLTTMAFFSATVGYAQVVPREYTEEFYVRNENELLSALKAISSAPDHDGCAYLIVLEDNITISKGHDLELDGAWITLDLSYYNLQGTQDLKIIGLEDRDSVLDIIGSTTEFNKGLSLHGDLTLNYTGVYTAGLYDIFGEYTVIPPGLPDEGDRDETKVTFLRPYSSWSAHVAGTQYIYAPLDRNDTGSKVTVNGEDYEPGAFMGTFGGGTHKTPKGTYIIGFGGDADVIVASGNTVLNTETVIGAKPDGTGVVEITGEDYTSTLMMANGKFPRWQTQTLWQGYGTFYVGYEGKGELKVVEGAHLQIGSIEVGRQAGSTGKMLVEGAGTLVTLFGREDCATTTLGVPIPNSVRGASEGAGTMNVTDGALVYFDSRKTLNGVESGFQPKITLGTGTSVVDNAMIVGATEGVIRDYATGQYLAEPYNRTKIGNTNVYLSHYDHEIDGYNIIFQVDASMGARDVDVECVNGDPDVPTDTGTITVLAGKDATYGDILAALNDTHSWDVTPHPNDPNKAYPEEDSFTMDVKGIAVDISSAIFPRNPDPSDPSKFDPLELVLGVPTPIQTGIIIGTDTLIFQNEAVLMGSLEIKMYDTITSTNGEIKFESGSIITPGFSKGDGYSTGYGNHLAFGKFDFTGNVSFDETVKTIIDFNVHGDYNFEDSNAYNLGDYIHGYGGNRGHDTITVVGNVELGGTIEFRPQSGYYSGENYDIVFGSPDPITGEKPIISITPKPYEGFIEIPFMQVDGDVTEQYDEMILYPNRWFARPDGDSNETLPRFITEAEYPGLLDKILLQFDELDEYGAFAVRDAAGNIIGYNGGVVLQLKRNTSPFTNAANSFNTRSVAGALDEIYNKQTREDWLPVLDWLWLMNDEELRMAMRQLAGETRATSFLMPIRSPWKFAFDRPDVNSIARYQKEQSAKAHCGDQDSRIFFSQPLTKTVRSDVWGTVFHDYMHANDDGNASKATKTQLGFVTGFDRVMSPRSTLGFVFAYTHPELKQLYSHVHADDFLFGLHYNTILQDRYELKLWGSYGTQAYRLRRNLPIKHDEGALGVNYTGNTMALSSQIAMPFRWKDFILRPFAAADLSYVQQNGATETGYEAIKLIYQTADWTQLYGRLGVKADYSCGRWDINASATYAALVAGRSAPMSSHKFFIEGESFRVKGNDLGCNFINIGLGGQRWLNDHKTKMLFVQHYGEYGKNANIQTFMLGCQVLF